jgi:hypothetical protein
MKTRGAGGDGDDADGIKKADDHNLDLLVATDGNGFYYYLL